MALDRDETGTELRSKSVSMGPKLGGPALKQLTFDWSAADKHGEFRNVRLEINNITQTYNTNMQTEYTLSKTG